MASSSMPIIIKETAHQAYGPGSTWDSNDEYGRAGMMEHDRMMSGRMMAQTMWQMMGMRVGKFVIQCVAPHAG